MLKIIKAWMAGAYWVKTALRASSPAMTEKCDD
jgi:hypothetical protein